MDNYDKCHQDVEQDLDDGKITSEQAAQYHREIEHEREDMTEHMIHTI